MAKHSSPRRARTRHPYRVAAFLLVTALLAAATAVFAYRRVDQRPAQIAVRVQATGLDRWVRIDDGEPVAAALLAAGALGHDGRLLSAKEHVVLDPRVDPAVLTVDGERVDPASVPVARDVVAIVDGKDRVEPTRTVREAVEPPAMDDVLVHVTEKGVPGTVERVLGATSGEVVSSRVIKAPIAPKRTDRKVVAFTFDDGPSALWTAKVLAVLQAKGIHATFCEIGTQVADQPQLSKAVVDQGHQLCNHTLHHDEGLKGADQAQLDEEIGGGAKAFTDQGLPAPSYYRPPGGFLDDAIKATVRGQHEQTLYWKVDTEDWRKGADTLTILRHVLDQVEPGAIILMHDGGGAERQPTIDALGLAIDHLKAEGYEFTFPVIAHS